MLKYLLRPYYTLPGREFSLGTKVMFLVNAYLICMIVTIVVMRLADGIDYLLTEVLHQQPIYKVAREADMQGDKAFRHRLLMIALVAPVLEELIFRLPLDLKKRSFAIAAFIISYVFQKLYFSPGSLNNTFYINYLLAGIISLAVYYRLPDSVLDKLREKNFRFFFYGSAIAFGLLHISNFYTGMNAGFFFLPLLVIPHTISGLFLGVIRMRYGFWWGVLLHVMFNLPAALMS